MLPRSLGQLDKPLQPPAANCSLGETESARIKPTQPHLPSLPTAHWAAAPLASHPNAPRTTQGQSISPFHGFSLEPPDILG